MKYDGKFASRWRAKSPDALCAVLPLGMCRGRCPYHPADLPEGSNFLGQPHRNRPAKFARCTRCPPGACQRRLLIGNVGIQAFSSVCGRLLFLRRLQDKPPLKGEGDQRSWWRGSVESFTSVSGFTEESLSQPAAASSLFKGA